MGHALNGTLQDVLVRWQRMRGLATPLAARLRPRGDRDPERRREGAREGGADAATTSAARRSSSASGRGSRSTAASSWASTGAWARRSTTRASASRWTRPTSRAVMRFFVHLYERAGSTATTGSSTGARAARPRSRTSRSCTRTSTTRSRTFATRSPTDDGHVTVATVRPPTILADVAVAVHPDDERYATSSGRR